MISLLILSISSGLLVQSISFASRQINTSRTLIAAEQLAISVLANHALLAARDGLDARLDPVSGLYWRSQKRTANRADENAALASVDLIIVEISLLNTAPPLYRIKTLDTTKTLDTNNPLDSLANAP